jgi:hypothetical protein
MLSRLYVVQMPEEVPTTPLDILVESAPGSKDAPALPGDGAYYEWRGRPLRLETLAADGVSGGFVPRLRLGFAVTITPYRQGVVTGVPGTQLSASLVGDVSTTDGGPSINVPALPDPNGEPAIRLSGDVTTAGAVYLVTLLCPEAKEDNAPRGS